jgi:hypothetical protein
VCVCVCVCVCTCRKLRIHTDMQWTIGSAQRKLSDRLPACRRAILLICQNSMRKYRGKFCIHLLLCPCLVTILILLFPGLLLSPLVVAEYSSTVYAPMRCCIALYHHNVYILCVNAFSIECIRQGVAEFPGGDQARRIRHCEKHGPHYHVLSILSIILCQTNLNQPDCH